MAETTRRRSGELLRKLFNILKQSPEGMSAAAALERLAAAIQLTEYEAGNHGSAGRRFEKIVRFGTVDCVKPGWLLKHKGTCMVTEAGLEAHRRFTDPEAFRREAARLYYIWRRGHEISEQESVEPVTEPGAEDAEKSSRITSEQAEEQAWGRSRRTSAPWTPTSFSGWSPTC